MPVFTRCYQARVWNLAALYAVIRIVNSRPLAMVFGLLAASLCLGQSELLPGDAAPPLDVQWVKGTPITRFEAGKVYVLDFWATWCGPCRATIPHLSELAKHYNGKAEFLGVSIWETDQAKVQPFVKDWESRMTYAVAMEVPGKLEKNERGRLIGPMAKAWMQASKRTTIPTAFIIDAEGKVAWFGSPSYMDVPLKQVIEGSWRRAQFAADVAVEKAMSDYLSLGSEEKWYEEAAKLIKSGCDPRIVNGAAWTLADPKSRFAKPRFEVAIALAERAAMLSERHHDILDTLAWAYFRSGEKTKAIEIETEALNKAPEAEKKAFRDGLKAFQGS